MRVDGIYYTTFTFLYVIDVYKLNYNQISTKISITNYEFSIKICVV